MGRIDWDSIPKIETHVHLEGAIPAELLLELHKKHGLKWKNLDINDIRKKLLFDDFYQFLNSFKEICYSIKEEEDYELITKSFFQRLESENIKHCEFFTTPAAAMSFGLIPEKVVEIILKTASDEAQRLNISWGLVLDNIRQFPPSYFEKTLDIAINYKRYGVIAIGVGGDERATTLNPFSRFFDSAKEHGLRIHIHSGEIGAPEAMFNDLQIAHPDRVGHGLAAAKSERVKDYLNEHNVLLDVCITSNLKTGIVESYKTHPVEQLLDMGVCLSISTDDPSLFDITLANEYRLAEKIIQNQDNIYKLLRCSLKNPVIPDRLKQWFRSEYTILSGFHDGE